MKFPFSLLFLLFLSPAILAQPYYFSQHHDTYQELSSSISINNTTAWSKFQTFTLPIGFSFDYIDSSFTSVNLEATGRLIFDTEHLYFLDLFVVNGLRDKSDSVSLSPLSYELTGTVGHQILKIEIQNATVSQDLSASLNFQIWLYEVDGAIELRTGNSTITSPSITFPNGAFCGISYINTFSPSIDYAYALALHGLPATPSDSTFTGTGINSFAITLSSFPVNGTVYRFEKMP